MRLLLDNLSARMAERSEAQGWNVVHVRDLGLQAARDEVVLQAVVDEERVLVGADTDFGQLLSRSRAVAPSVVLVRRAVVRRVEALADLLLAQPPALGLELDAGCVVAIGEDSIRVRSLPLGRTRASRW